MPKVYSWHSIKENRYLSLVLLVLILLVLPALGLDLMRQRGWISEQPTWALLGLAAATGVVVGRWLRNRQQ